MLSLQGILKSILMFCVFYFKFCKYRRFSKLFPSVCFHYAV